MGNASTSGLGFMLPYTGPPAFPGKTAWSCGGVVCALCPPPPSSCWKRGYPGGRALSPLAVSPVTAPSRLPPDVQSDVLTPLPELLSLRASWDSRRLRLLLQEAGKRHSERGGNPAPTGSVPCPHDELVTPGCAHRIRCRQRSEGAAWRKLAPCVSSSTEGAARTRSPGGYTFAYHSAAL